MNPIPRTAHRIDVAPSADEVRVLANGETVARTRRALLLSETGLPVRYYIPAEDIRMDLLTPSPTSTFCRYKGSASYWSLRIGDHVVADVAWAYMDPLPERADIKGYLCF